MITIIIIMIIIIIIIIIRSFAASASRDFCVAISFSARLATSTPESSPARPSASGSSSLEPRRRRAARLTATWDISRARSRVSVPARLLRKSWRRIAEICGDDETTQIPRCLADKDENPGSWNSLPRPLPFPPWWSSGRPAPAPCPPARLPCRLLPRAAAAKAAQARRPPRKRAWTRPRRAAPSGPRSAGPAA